MRILILLSLYIFSTTTMAAVRNDWSANQLNKEDRIQTAMLALESAPETRRKLIRSLGEDAKSVLEQLAFSKTQKMAVRWKSITALGMYFSSEATDAIDLALRSDEWFLRNAALVVTPNINRAFALKWAKHLLKDEALVVRTSAVQVIKKIGAVELQQDLWQELYSKRNFRNEESLWVRRHIAEALAKFAYAGQEKQFAKLLTDRDANLHQPAMKALQLITGQNFSDLPQEQQRQAWLQWSQQNDLLVMN